jgi:hypothetical protein
MKSSNHLRAPALLALALVVAAAPSGFAQITAATIWGTVKDQTGAVLPGVDLVVRNLDTGLTRTAVTNEQGLFTVPGLPPGRYEARASLPGFSTGVRPDIELSVGQEAGIDLVLKVGAAEESIDVVATAVMVDTRSSVLSALVPEKTIEELPLNGRNYINLATLQPGIINFVEKSGTSSSTRGVQLNINGMGGRSNSFLIDGANMKGYAGIATVTAADSTLGVETIREFRVVTNAFSADYGRAMGGVVSIVTKAGGNDVHGSGFEFVRNSRLDTRNFFDPVSGPPDFTRNQYGLSFGGPIRKNKLFFFGGYERLQEDLGLTLLTTVPDQAARNGFVPDSRGNLQFVGVNQAVKPYLDLYPLPNAGELIPPSGVPQGIGQFIYPFNRPTRENFGQGRVDMQVSATHALFVRHTYDGAHQVLPSGTVSFPQFSTDSTSSNQFLTVEEKWIVSPAVLNTGRFSNSILKFEQLPANILQEPLAFFPQAPHMGSIAVTGLTTLGNDNTLPSTNNVTYWTWSDDLTYTKGKHLVKIGALVEHAHSSKQTTTSSRGAYTFNDLTHFLQGNANQFQGVLPGSILVRERPNTLFGFYVQDDYRVAERLTLNLGARYEFFTVPSDRHGIDAYVPNIYTDRATVVGGPFVNPSFHDIAPRVGFAWDMSGDGRTAIRGGSGLYYDTDGTFNSAFGIAAFTPPFAPTVNLTSNVTFPNPVFPTNNTTPGALALRTLDYHIKQPKGWTYNANVQRELGSNMVATIGYAGSRGYHLVSAIEGNPVVPDVEPDGSLFFPAGARKRNPAWGTIDYRTSNGHSTYNALQSTLLKRFDRGYQVQVSYTLSKTMDNTQAQLNVDSVNTSVYPQNPYNPDADWAPAAFDYRHVFSANVTWEVPGLRSNLVFGGWQLNSIVSLRSGLPFSPSLSRNWSRDGNTFGEDRPNVKPGIDPSAIITGNPRQWFDPTAFVLQQQGTLGNTPRDFLRGPAFADVDLSLVKNQKLTGGTKVQVKLEVFNLLNRANFAVPSRVVFAGATAGDPILTTAGQITHTTNSSRQLQLGFKFIF